MTPSRAQFEMVEELVAIAVGLLEAPLLPRAWHRLVDLVVARHGAASGVILAASLSYSFRAEPIASRLMRESRLDIPRRYADAEDAEDATLYARLLPTPMLRLHAETEIMGVARVEDLSPSRWREFLCAEVGARHRHAMTLSHYVDRADVLALHWTEAAGPPSRREQCRIEALAPLLAASLRLRRVFEALRRHAGMALGALDRLGVGALVVTEDGQVVVANPLATRILEARDGLCLRRDRLRAPGAAGEALAVALHAAWRAAEGRRMVGDAILCLPRPSGRPDLLVSVSAMVDGAGEIEVGLACAMVFVADPADATPLSVEGLRVAGGLTRAEAEVCALLVEGCGLAEASERRGVSTATVKAQSRTILAKLGCSGRADLVRLAALTRLPILADGERP